MKTSVDILKSWFQTGDKPSESQFSNLIDSFHHKDDGQLITNYKLFSNGNLSLTFSDGITANIQRFALPNTMPLNFIEGLVDALNQKVTKTQGKDLSDENFTLELKQKLEELENYVHPDFHQIEEIEGLQILLESKMDRDGLKQLTDENFTLEEKEKLAELENYTPPSSQPISYIETLQDTLDVIEQNIDNKVEKEDGKGLSANDFTNEEKTKLAGLTSVNTFGSITDGVSTITASEASETLTFEGVTIDEDTKVIKVASSGLKFNDYDVASITTDATFDNSVVNALRSLSINVTDGNYSMGVSPRNGSVVNYTIPDGWKTNPEDFSEIIFRDHLIVLKGDQTITFY
ncbi:hypothetical protein [Tenacibaculum sp. M341]|uniref:hypothetical protein n=1 Tax=Tenacibaculum sp. M341 TaxID=2530339 RepID=UPI001044B597|nr:hypothetical protein [Tenacibaculum sp. M341]TCI93689.1 hypothetical protein EYW44_04545 [Tenacibaculum sp. M341]